MCVPSMAPTNPQKRLEFDMVQNSAAISGNYSGFGWYINLFSFFTIIFKILVAFRNVAILGILKHAATTRKGAPQINYKRKTRRRSTLHHPCVVEVLSSHRSAIRLQYVSFVTLKCRLNAVLSPWWRHSSSGEPLQR